jgi:hypothetical protein
MKTYNRNAKKTSGSTGDKKSFASHPDKATLKSLMPNDGDSAIIRFLDYSRSGTLVVEVKPIAKPTPKRIITEKLPFKWSVFNPDEGPDGQPIGLEPVLDAEGNDTTLDLTGITAVWSHPKDATDELIPLEDMPSQYLYRSVILVVATVTGVGKNKVVTPVNEVKFLEYGYGEIKALDGIVNDPKDDSWAINPETGTPEYDVFINRTGKLPNYYVWSGIDDRDRNFKESAERFQVPADECFDDTLFEEVERVFVSMQEDRITQRDLVRIAAQSKPKSSTTGLAAGPNNNALEPDGEEEEDENLPPSLDNPKDLGSRETPAEEAPATKQYGGFRGRKTASS